MTQSAFEPWHLCYLCRKRDERDRCMAEERERQAREERLAMERARIAAEEELCEAR